MRKFSLKLVIFCTVLLNSCNTKIFVPKQNVINKTKGIAVFIDKREVGHQESGDVFTDSLIPDFFIPYNFPKLIVQKQQLINSLYSADGKTASFFYLKGDCNEEERNSSIEKECITITLDQTIDNYIKSNKIFLLPVEITYLKNNINKEYLAINKQIVLKHENRIIKIGIERGYLDVLHMDVLEYKWE